MLTPTCSKLYVRSAEWHIRLRRVKWNEFLTKDAVREEATTSSLETYCLDMRPICPSKQQKYPEFAGPAYHHMAQESSAQKGVDARAE
jgi:hypothetical protein